MTRNLLIAILSITLFTSCKKETVISEHDGTASLNFDAVVNSEDFALNKDFTIDGATYNFDHLRYWVSNVVLVSSSGSEYKVPDAYYLLEETTDQQVQDGSFTYPARKREAVDIADVPMGDYKAIKFSIGVDEKYNNNLSLQSGELSQLNGMTNISWMWHTTYIFTALGGSITESGNTENLKVETGLNANFKTISLDFSSPVKISSAKSTAIDLKVDVAKIFDGVDVAATPVIGASEETEMTTIANNYGTKVFSIKVAK
jgi:hypothetical protein